MCKSEYTVEDFVLDPEFKKRVLKSNSDSKVYWEAYLKKNPSKIQDLVLAKKILLNLSRKEILVQDERIRTTWLNIADQINQVQDDEIEASVIPIYTETTLHKYNDYSRSYSTYHQLFRIAAILIISFSLAFSYGSLTRVEPDLVSEILVEYEEHFVPPGVKSHLTLLDGSKVILNSGSSIRYIKNFEPHQREIELTGEAFFEVTKDPKRPFIVKTNHLTTTVLGTSFNINAFEERKTEVSLVTGKVEVRVNSDKAEVVNLVPGEALRFFTLNQTVSKGGFDKTKVLAWTQKTIVFNQAQMKEVKRVLENWYGVEIQFVNTPAKDLEISARFNDQTLKDVLEGLSYSARFDFSIQKEKVFIRFK